MKFGFCALLLALLASVFSNGDASSACSARFSADTCFTTFNR